jgi:hypothetical protein
MRSHPRPPRRLFAAFAGCPAGVTDTSFDAIDRVGYVVQRAPVRLLQVLDSLDGFEQIA